MKNAVIPFLVGVVTIVAAVFGLYVLIEAVLYAPDGGATVASAKIVTASPAQLTIPSIGVNASVSATGETATGAIGTPHNLTSVAWFTGSAVPGKQGVAIIDGHVDNGLGLAGVFKRLGKIQPGAVVAVTMSNGTVVRFAVTNITAYPYDSVPMGQLVANTAGAPLLRLITCEGQWLGSQKTYDERLVVTAVAKT